MPNNILVTGANGFVGSHMIFDLCKKGDQNLVVSMFRDYRSDVWTRTALNEAVEVKVDLNHPNALEKLKRILSHYHIEQIYHFASQAIVSRAKKNPIDTYMTNIMGTAKVLEAARYIGDIDIVYMSTDKTYGEGHKEGTNHGLVSTEAYSSSKIAAEYIVHDYRRQYEMNISVTRACNIIGYDPYNPSRIVPMTIIKLLTGKTPVIWESAVSNSHRQYIYIDDAVKIIKQTMGKNQYYNIGSPYIKTAREVITTICKLMDKPKKYTTLQVPFSEIKQQSLGYDHEFNYTPFIEALRIIVKRFKDYYWC